MRIAFIWQGFSGRYGHWEDGLYAAMKLIEKEHEVKYFDFPLDGIHEFNPDVVLYWEAPSTILGKDQSNYLNVCSPPYPKSLLFAGGPIKREWVSPFDLVFVESEINEKELTEMEIPWKRAFGVNTQIMKPSNVPKLYWGFMQATFAGWKRHELFAKALRASGAVMGRKQEFDLAGYNECVKQRVNIFPEGTATQVAHMINSSRVVVNTADYWGGGQRCTLEAMACGVPVLVMSDSPKNIEFVRASKAGSVVDPNPIDIEKETFDLAFHDEKKGNASLSANGIKYIQENWTETHYKNAILEGIHEILNPLS